MFSFIFWAKSLHQHWNVKTIEKGPHFSNEAGEQDAYESSCMSAHKILKSVAFLLCNFQNFKKAVFTGQKGQLSTDGRAFLSFMTEQLHFDVWQQMSSISFSVEFWCSIHIETTPEVISFYSSPCIFHFLLGVGGGRCLPLVTEQLENSDLACQLLGVM